MKIQYTKDQFNFSSFDGFYAVLKRCFSPQIETNLLLTWFFSTNLKSSSLKFIALRVKFNPKRVLAFFYAVHLYILMQIHYLNLQYLKAQERHGKVTRCKCLLCRGEFYDDSQSSGVEKMGNKRTRKPRSNLKWLLIVLFSLTLSRKQ